MRVANKKRFFSFILVLLIIIGATTGGIYFKIKTTNFDDIALLKQMGGFSVHDNLPRVEIIDNLYKDNLPDVLLKRIIKKGVKRDATIEVDHVNGSLILVNSVYTLSKDYIPKNIVSLKDSGQNDVFESYNNEIIMPQFTINKLKDTISNIPDYKNKSLMVTSGFRDYERQSKVFNESIAGFKSNGMSDEEALLETKKEVAVPGTSEHQTGLAVDLGTTVYSGGKEKFGETKDGKAMLEIAYVTGFVNRYAGNKTSITGIKSEPWHFRYVAVPHSYIMKKYDFCLEEYISFIQINKRFLVDLANGNKYEIYYIPKNPDSMTKVPITSIYPYEISYDNVGGYVVTVNITGYGGKIR